MSNTDTQIKTIEDLVRAVYGNPDEFLFGQPMFGSQKSKADITTTTTNFHQVKYGAKIFRNMNDQINAWGIMPKYVFTRSGTTVSDTDGGSSADGGTAEAGAIPSTINYTLQRYAAKPKEVLHAFAVSTKQHYLAKFAEDDAAADMDESRYHTEIKHKKALGQQILKDVDVVAGNGFESIDRVCSANSEISLINANDADIYGIDRDAGAGFSDAYVDHNAGVDRDFTDGLLRDMINNLEEAGSELSVFLTGYDTYTNMLGVYQTQVRYNTLNSTMVQVGVNGINTDEGIKAGVRIATVYGTPIIRDPNVVKDTASRLYGLDTSANERTQEPLLGIKMAIPTLYFETGPQIDNDIFKGSGLVNKGVLYTSGELWCNDFSRQGKLRDLK